MTDITTVYNFNDEAQKRHIETRYSHLTDVRVLFAMALNEKKNPFSLAREVAA